MPDYNKLLDINGITHTSDGLLRDQINRKLYAVAAKQINQSIKKRQDEIDFLISLQMDLTYEITNDPVEGTV